MKRDELLDKLEKCYISLKDMKYADRTIVDRLLELCEENGMLPPNTDWLVNNKPEEMHWSEVHDYHLWEPET